MRAIVIPKFAPDVSVLRPIEVPTPQPKPDQFLVRITHISPQHADILHARGQHQNNTKRGWCHPPFILGFDFAGAIESIPSHGNDEELKTGDRVFGASIGAFAEYICVPQGSVRKIPAKISSEYAVAMSGQAVSYASVVNIAKVKAGETVLVSGASGGLGSVCCMVAKAVGAQVIALAGDEEKARCMREDMGMDHVVVMKDNWTDRIMDITNGNGADVCLDNIGMVNDAIRCLAYFGRIVILGFAARKGVMEEVKMNKLLLKSITVIGYRFGESGRRYPQLLEEIWQGYMNMLETGELKPFLYGSYRGLNDVGRALKDLEDRKVYGKIVVTVNDSSKAGKL